MSSPIDETRDFAASIDGWLEDCEGELLFNLAKQCRGKGAIVEIGSWKGKSTVWLARGSLAGNAVKVWAVDPYTGSEEHHKAFGEVWTFNEFKKNIAGAGVGELVRPIVNTSKAAASTFAEPVELIFIDGAHDYESVRMDFDLWFPKLVEGGFMALHDCRLGVGPSRVVVESLCRSRLFGAVRIVGAVAYAQKVKERSVGEKLRNRLVPYLLMPPTTSARYLPKPLRFVVRRILKSVGIL